MAQISPIYTNPNFIIFLILTAATSQIQFLFLHSFLMFFSLSCYNALNSQFSLHSPSLVYSDTHGLLVSANFATNWGEPIRESTANRSARTNSRFASQPSELCYYVSDNIQSMGIKLIYN